VEEIPPGTIIMTVNRTGDRTGQDRGGETPEKDSREGGREDSVMMM